MDFYQQRGHPLSLACSERNALKGVFVDGEQAEGLDKPGQAPLPGAKV